MECEECSVSVEFQVQCLEQSQIPVISEVQDSFALAGKNFKILFKLWPQVTSRGAHMIR